MIHGNRVRHFFHCDVCNCSLQAGLKRRRKQLVIETGPTEAELAAASCAVVPSPEAAAAGPGSAAADNMFDFKQSPMFRRYFQTGVIGALTVLGMT